MGKVEFTRTLRTPFSERFVLKDGDQDIGAVDLHFLEGGRVAATLTLLDDRTCTPEQIEAVISRIDDLLLPDVSREEGKIVFTVVRGKVVGSYIGSG